MKYLVTMELIGSPPMASPQELVQWLEQMIIPTEEAMIKLEADKKAHFTALWQICCILLPRHQTRRCIYRPKPHAIQNRPTHLTSP